MYFFICKPFFISEYLTYISGGVNLVLYSSGP